jgi:hypothetical protein
MLYNDQEKFADFRQRLFAVLQDVEARGVAWKNTRYSEYLKILDAASSLDYPRAASWNEDQHKLWEAAVQCQMLVASEAVWSGLDADILVVKLGQVVKGRPFESPSDDNPRNTLVELTVAALLARQGANVRITLDEADILATFAGVPTFAVECKRPTKAANFRKNLREANEQIKRRLSPDTPHGIAVIAVDRQLDMTKKGLSAPDERTIGTALEAEQRRLSRLFRNLAKKPHCNLFPQTPIIATLVTGAVFNLGAGIPVTIVHLGMSCTGPEDAPESRRLLSALAASFPDLLPRPPHGMIVPAPTDWRHWPPALRGSGNRRKF